MKTTTKITIEIVQHGANGNQPRTFTAEDTREMPDSNAFPHVVAVAEVVLGNVHRLYCPTPAEQAEREEQDTNARREHLEDDAGS